MKMTPKIKAAINYINTVNELSKYDNSVVSIDLDALMTDPDGFAKYTYNKSTYDINAMTQGVLNKIDEIKINMFDTTQESIEINKEYDDKINASLNEIAVLKKCLQRRLTKEVNEILGEDFGVNLTSGCTEIGLVDAEHTTSEITRFKFARSFSFYIHDDYCSKNKSYLEINYGTDGSFDVHDVEHARYTISIGKVLEQEKLLEDIFQAMTLLEYKKFENIQLRAEFDRKREQAFASFKAAM